MGFIGNDGDRGFLVVTWMGGHDVWYEGLGVAVVEREPGALHLNHYRVALFEDVIHGMEAVPEFMWLVCC